MAIVTKKEQDPAPGDVPADPNAAPAEPRHNLPLKATPVVGRKAEMQRVVQIFEKIRREGRPRRVEVVGPMGVGASTVAVELARRAGHRFPGGAWYVNLGMGADVAWATLGALRGSGPVKNLPAAAKAARERLGEEPKALLVIDGVTSSDEAMAALPPTTENSADVFLVSEKPLGTVDGDQVCEVGPVPRHGARRMAQSMLRHSQPDAKAPPVEAPPVRTLDGLAITATLAARAALAYQGKEGPISIEDTNAAMQRIVRLVARHPTALELLLLASVGHPVALPVQSLVGALAHVRKGRGKEATPDEANSGVMWLAHAGIVEPLDDRHFSMHPLLQKVVHGMTASPKDLEVAREALSVGLLEEAEASITDDGVDLPRASLHQLRFLATTTEGDIRARLAAMIARLESALGVAGAGN
jgi:hypothetical protein